MTPRGEETISCSYSVEGDHDGPALVFRYKVGTRDGEDRIVWHLKYFGLEVYKSAEVHLASSGWTYFLADESIKKQIPELTEQEPNKPDAGDGK